MVRGVFDSCVYRCIRMEMNLDTGAQIKQSNNNAGMILHYADLG